MLKATCIFNESDVFYKYPIYPLQSGGCMICKVYYVTAKNIANPESHEIKEKSPWLRERIRVITPDGRCFVFKSPNEYDFQKNKCRDLIKWKPSVSCFARPDSRFQSKSDPQKAYDKDHKMHVEFLGEWDFGRNFKLVNQKV